MNNRKEAEIPLQFEESPLFLREGIHNYVFLGEAGCGKSEIALNLALALAGLGKRAVHFYDLDMTKPLFRSRDQAALLEGRGVAVHYEEQFYDAPTVAGGVMRQLRDTNSFTVLDVGGDYIGARSVGGYAPLLNAPGTAVFYVINPYRPWSMDIEHIDQVLGQTLGVSHVELARLQLLGNPNLGPETTLEEVLLGTQKLRDMVGPYKPVEGCTVRRGLYSEAAARLSCPVFPIDLYLTYEWVQENTVLP